MIEFSSLLLFTGALVVAASTPGPSIAAMVSRVLVRGWRDVMPFLIAMWIGEAMWMTAAVLGLAAIADTLTWLFLTIKYLGIAYLLYLAWQMWNAAPVENEGGADTAGQGSPINMFLAGMSVTLGNPKIIVFYMALLPTLVNLQTITFAGWAVLCAVTIGVLAVIDTAYMALAARARHYFRSPRAMRVANRVGGTAMGGAAVVIASR